MGGRHGRRWRPRAARRRAARRGAASDTRLSVRCRLCGAWYRSITASHLRFVHGAEDEHPVWAYRARFDLDAAMCDELRDRMREVQIERWRRQGRHWPPERVLAEVRRLDRRPGGIDAAKIPYALHGAAHRHFGGWEKALRAAGIRAPALPARYWTKKEVLAAIRSRHRAGESVSWKTVRAAAPKLHEAAKRFFRNWTDGLDAARIPPGRTRPRRWRLQEARRWVLERHARGLPLGGKDVPEALGNWVRRTTGAGWPAFVRSLGIAYEPHASTYPTKEAVLAAIRRRVRQGLSVTYAAVYREDRPLRDAAQYRFRSWQRALVAADLDPKEHRASKWSLAEATAWVRTRHAKGLSVAWKDAPRGLRGRVERDVGVGWAAFVTSLGVPYTGRAVRRDWTDQKVLEEIRARRRRGLALGRGEIRREAYALYQQAQHRFGSLDAALRAAGIPERSIPPPPVRWTKAKVVAAIRARAREGRSLLRKDVQADDSRLLRAALERFPYSWNVALAAANVGSGPETRPPRPNRTGRKRSGRPEG